jgi:hypothetical protein
MFPGSRLQRRATRLDTAMRALVEDRLPPGAVPRHIAEHEVMWNVANTGVAPVNTAKVKISLSVDSGHTYPYVLAASTPHTGSASVVLPMVGTTHARVKIEAVDNVFFDVSNADFAITWPYTGFFSPILSPPGVNSLHTARFSFR